MRINRFIARTGKASRRKAEELIKTGSVFVNGQKITELATEIDPQKDKVLIEGEVATLPELKYLMLNKPEGYTNTKADKYAEKTVYELLPPDPSLFSVGRLDKNTTGLLLITNDGNFTQNITHPKQKIEKEYKVVTKNPVGKDDLNKLITGVELEDGPAKAVAASLIEKNKFSLTITEGRNRQVRRMVAAIGNEVKELKRTRIGTIELDVQEGKYRELTPEETNDYI